MKNNKQSSVEWLIKKLQNREKGIFDGLPHLSLDEIYNQAKAMHKEEIIKSCNAGLSGVPRSAKQYYEQEYGGNK